MNLIVFHFMVNHMGNRKVSFDLVLSDNVGNSWISWVVRSTRVMFEVHTVVVIDLFIPGNMDMFPPT